LHAGPIQAIRADPELWETAIGRPPFTRFWGDEPLPEISQALLTVLPAGRCQVSHFDDRSHEQAEYLLDPIAYRTEGVTWRQRERSLAYRMIRGAEPFAAHAISGQGISWRCSSSTFVAAVQRLDRLDVAGVRREFSVAEMDTLGLYKVHPDEDDDHAFTRILGQLRAFTEHCRTVTAQGLDLIITLQ
jgi:hypothetical protein